MARKKKNPLQAQLEKDIASFKRSTSLKKGFENTKRETKRAVRELTIGLDLPKSRTTRDKNHPYVAGKSSRDLGGIGNADFNKMTKAELRAVVSRMADTANKRLKRFEKAGIDTSPAYFKAIVYGGKFTTKGKDINGLRAEYVRVKSFLDSKTSTIRGWRDVKRQTIGELKKHGIQVNERDFNALWMIYDRLKEEDPSVSTRQFKYRVLGEISDALIDNKNPNAGEQIFETIKNRLNSIYEEKEELMSDGVSGFFEI